jgi:hypothetical protein
VYYHSASNSVHYSFGKDDNHDSGRIFFTEDHLAFAGTVHNEDGTITAVRGNLRKTIYNTQRKLDCETSYVTWGTLTIGTEWVDDGQDKRLKSIFFLGDEDVSNRTAVTKVDDWKTTIEMMPSSNPITGNVDSFIITTDYTGRSFSGTYTDENGEVYAWKGIAQDAGTNVAHVSSYRMIDGEPLKKVVAPMCFTEEVRSQSDTGPDLSVQDLLNVSSIMSVKVDGQDKILDVAQEQTGLYFQSILINSLDEKWIDDFFGSKKIIPDGVKTVMNNHSNFYKSKAVMNLGQMVHDCFGTDQAHKDIVKKIDNEKLSKAWKALGTDTDYAAQSSELYIEGYKNGVTGIQPYLNDNPKGWAKKLHDTIISDDFLNIWAVQVASEQFKNVKSQMYEWYVQLCVLDPDNTEQANDMLNTTFSVVLGAMFRKAQWIEDMKPYLAKAIENMLNGHTTDFQEDMLKNNAEKQQENLREMINAFDTIEQFTDALINAMNIWAARPKNAGKPAIRAANEVFEEMAASPKVAGKWEKFNTVGGGIFGSLIYAAGAGYLLYQITSGADLNPVEDVNLALLATGFMVKSVEKLLSTGLGKWIRKILESKTGKIAEFAKSLTKWFSEGGIEAEGWAVKVFGKSSAEFFAKRIGPALALVGVALCSYFLAEAIKTGDVKNIIFESISTFFALGDVVFLGLEMASFAWAGPVGLAIAVVGILVALVQLIWNIIDPPSPPLDPVEEFVSGPLTAAGFANA